MKWIVDRIEGDIAVLELSSAKTINIPLSDLPEGIKENDVISLVIDYDNQSDRKEKISSLEDSLFID